MGKSIEEQREEIRNKKREILQYNLEKRLENKFYIYDYLVKGIYFLYHKNRIVYIGKSNGNVFKRISKHHEEGVKKFDCFTFEKYDVSDSDLLHIESVLIKRYNPIYNKTHNKYNRKIKLIYCGM